MTDHVLFELNICNKVAATLYTLRKENISCACDRNNVRMFAEWLERYGVVDLS